MFLKRKMNDSTTSYSDKILQIKEKIEEAEAVVIVRDFPHQPVLCIMEKDLKNIFRISERNMDFPICIQEASIHIKHWKNTGDTGADISILIDIWMHQNRYIRTCMIW